MLREERDRAAAAESAQNNGQLSPQTQASFERNDRIEAETAAMREMNSAKGHPAYTGPSGPALGHQRFVQDGTSSGSLYYDMQQPVGFKWRCLFSFCLSLPNWLTNDGVQSNTNGRGFGR